MTRQPASATTASTAPFDQAGRLPSLDGLRAVSIIMVLGYHAWGKPFDGHLGVQIFFVLSGFLITRLLLKERQLTGAISLSGFYARRALRLWPVHVALIAVLLILDATTRLDIAAKDYLVALFYLVDFFHVQTLLTHLWSLSVEEQFYIVWSLVMVFAPRRIVVVALAILALAPCVRVLGYFIEVRPLSVFSIFTNADSLMAGCLAAILIERDPVIMARIIAWRPELVRFGSIAAICAIETLKMNYMINEITLPLGQSVNALCAAYLIVSLAFAPSGALGWLLNTRPLVALGLISYSVYIWQHLFMWPGVYSEGDRLITTPPLNLILSILAGTVSYFALERPFIAWRKRVAALTRSPTSPASSPRSPARSPATPAPP